MPFQEDKGSEDVPNLLSARNRGSYTMDGTADFFFFCDAGNVDKWCQLTHLELGLGW